MSYSLLLDNNPFLSGNLSDVVLILLITFLVVIGIIITVAHKLKENNQLKYEFITIIAHKFRTPLTHAKWIIETILPTETDSTNRESLSDMQKSVDNLINLTGTLIELTDTGEKSKSSYVLEDINICDFVKLISAPFKDLFHEKNIVFTVACESEKIMVNADRSRLEFVFQTLLENAYTYTPPGKSVDIRIGVFKNKAVVVVADSGIGISPNDIPKMFSKFYRTENARLAYTEGLGVGLFLAREIVKKHGGRLEVSSPGINQGSTFRMVMPRE